jgi:hypothetical protein
MRTIRVIEHISLDGVIQAPGGPNEDDYPYGGWAVPHHDDAGEAIAAAQGDAFDLLLGRQPTIYLAAIGQKPRVRWRIV